MSAVNMFEAKSSLSRLVDAVETGRESEIIIAARLVPIVAGSSGQRIGIAKGLFEVPDCIDGSNDAVAALFAGDPS